MAQSDPQTGTNFSPALGGLALPAPADPTAPSDPTAPAFDLRAWLIRLSLLAVGLLAMRQALYIFYFQPWMGAASPLLDPWLERTRCLVSAWCGPSALRLHHGGVLLLGVALLCFGVALRTRREDWPSGSLPAWPAWLARPRATRIAILLFSLMAAEAVLYAAYQRWGGGAPPTVLTWIAGVGALIAAALLWDLEERTEWATTVTGLLVYGGIALAALGAGSLLARTYVTALLLPVGIGLVWLGSRRSRAESASGVSLQPLDYWLMLGISLLALVLAMRRALDWHFTFVGDEWIFYQMDHALLANPATYAGYHSPFATHDSDHYHVLLPSILSALLMYITRTDVYGWRLTSVLPFVWSVPAVYVLGNWLAGRTAAWLGAALFAGSHVLLAFSLVPKNITFSLLTLTLVLAGLVWAESSRSALRYVLAGVVLGLGFILHALALLILLPVGIWLLAQNWRAWRRLFVNGGLVAAGFTVAAAPLLVDIPHWQALLKATPVQSEVAAKYNVVEQVLRNVTAGLIAFVADVTSRYNHFTAAGNTDPVTAVLLVMGVGATLAALLYTRRVRTWWLATGLFWLAVVGVQQYGYLSITRTFILVAVYAVLAGVGGAALVRLLLPTRPTLGQALAVVIAVAGVGLNQVHIDRVSLPLGRDTWHLYAFMVQQLQAVAAQDEDVTVAVVTKRPDARLTEVIVDAYGLAGQMPTVMDGGDFLADEELCAASDRPVVVLVTAGLAQPARIERRLASCWDKYEETVIVAPWARPILYRYATASAAQALPPLEEP